MVLRRQPCLDDNPEASVSKNDFNINIKESIFYWQFLHRTKDSVVSLPPNKLITKLKNNESLNDLTD
jgi:hypothetical protein